jgi:hypothetical protein
MPSCSVVPWWRWALLVVTAVIATSCTTRPERRWIFVGYRADIVDLLKVSETAYAMSPDGSEIYFQLDERYIHFLPPEFKFMHMPKAYGNDDGWRITDDKGRDGGDIVAGIIADIVGEMITEGSREAKKKIILELKRH